MRLKLSRREALLLGDILDAWIDGYADSAYEAEDTQLVNLLHDRHEAQRILDRINRRLRGRG